MSTKIMILSSAGLKNIIRDNNEFTFSFGDREIRMDNIFAEFISPIVSHLHHSDPTINQLCYKMPPNTKIPRFDEIFTDDLITKLKLISSGVQTELNETESQKMRLASILLCNEELFNKIDELFPADDSADEMVKRLEELEVCEIMKNMTNEIKIDIGSIVSVIARNFYLIDKSKIKTISKPLFHSIISNDHLRIETEDCLFDTITEYFECEVKEDDSESDFSCINSFLEEVRMRKLSDSKFKELLQRVEAGKMTESLWRSICDRICREGEGSEDEGSRQRYTKETAKQPSQSVRTFSFDGQECNRLNGIVRFLTKKIEGGNVHEKDVVSVTASSEYPTSCAKNTVDFDNVNTYLCTYDVENSWLKYDFKDLKVRPTQYSIRSKPHSTGDFHPMHWVIEGSNSDNDNDWTAIDSRSDVKSLNAQSVICTFDIQRPVNDFYRYLRLRQTGKNACGSNKLGLSSLEYFGSVI